MGILKPEKIIKAIIPVIMAGILGIYGLIVGVILVQKVNNHNEYTYTQGFSHLASGLCCGISAWAAGIAIGIAGDAGARSLGQQDKVFVGMMLILIFAEALGLYGLIVAVILVQKVNDHEKYDYDDGFKQLAGGLCCGISSWAAGIAIGMAGDAGARALGQQDKVFVGMMLILIFAEAIGLYGLIVSLILTS